MKPRILLGIQVSLQSKRLPDKAILKIGGKETIRILIERALKSHVVDNFCLCISTLPQDEKLLQIGWDAGINSYKGHPKDVLSRFVEAAEIYKADHIVRVTGDDILLDPKIMDNMIIDHIHRKAEYTYSSYLAKGTECEVISYKALEMAFEMSRNQGFWRTIPPPEKSEYMSNYFKDDKMFKKNDYKPPLEHHYQHVNLTMDTESDYKRLKEIFGCFKPDIHFNIVDMMNNEIDLESTCI